jgi:hypothetical protein
MARAVTFQGKDLKGKNPAAGGLSAGQTRCWRCEGLMVVEQCSDLTGDSGHLDCQVRRCVQCGEVIDPVVLQNRRLQLEKNLARV